MEEDSEGSFEDGGQETEEEEEPEDLSMAVKVCVSVNFPRAHFDGKKRGWYFYPCIF